MKTTQMPIHAPRRPLPGSVPRFGRRGDEGGFVLIMSLVLLVLLTLLGVLAMNTSDFENMVAGGVQQAEVNFNVAEGGNYLEACNVGFGKREWYKLADPEQFEKPMMPDKQSDFNPGGRKRKKGLLMGDEEYRLADYDEKKAPENVRMWPFGNLKAKEKDDGMVSTEEADYEDVTDSGGKIKVLRTPYDYRYLVTYMSYENIRLPGYSTEVGGFGTYTFRIQSAPAGEGGVVETAGLKYGMQQTL